MQLTACPEKQTWDRLLDGECSAAESQALELHLDCCKSCRSELSETFAGLRLDTQIAPALPPQDRIKMLTSELKALWPMFPAKSRRIDEPLDFSLRFGPLAPGETGLGRLGHYVVKRLLGQGGMGCVLLAEDTRLSREVAIKIMNSSGANNQKQKAKFLQEARAVAAIHNDHVVEIHHVDQDRGMPFFVMPFLQGETLYTRLRREKTLLYADVLRIGREIALGLAAAHGGKRKLIHRDVKPLNIWLEAGHDRVKLLDFGLAIDLNSVLSLTHRDALKGTAPYMSPEQARCDDDLDERTDLFSLGAVLYEMSTGQMAFNRRGLANTLNAVIGEQPTPPDQLVFDLPVEFSQLVMRLLSKDPAGRPESAVAVAAELQDLQRATQRDAAYPTVAEKPAHEQVARKAVAKSSPVLLSRRNRPALAAAAAALLSLAFLAVIVINHGNGQLVIEADEAIQVTVLEDKNVLLKDLKANTTLRLRPGKHEFDVLLKNAAGDELGRFTTTDYKIVRGGKPVLNIRQEAAKAGVQLPPKRDAAPPENTGEDRDRRAAEFIVAFPGSKCRVHVNGQDLNLEAGATLPAAGKVSLGHVDWVGPETPIAELIDRLNGTNVRFLNLQRTSVKDADLKELPGLEQLHELQLGEVSGLTDDCLIPVSQLPALSRLSMNTMPVTDTGIAHLEGKSSLTYLMLYGTNISDRGISSLRQCANLMGLELGNTQITDEALQDISSLKQLIQLNVGGTRVTEHGLEQLDQLPKLEKVALWGIEISDAGVMRLIEKHPRLDRLDLGSTQVTDAIIPSVLTLKNLQGLIINMTSISGRGYDTLRAAFPNAGILWQEQNHEVANSILSAGGEVTLRVVGAEQDQILAKPASLPKELFRIRSLRIGVQDTKPDHFDEHFGRAMGNLFGGYPTTEQAFGDLTVLEFSGLWFTDAYMQPLRRSEHPDVMRAWSWHPEVPTQMSWLRELSLAKTAITDDALAQLGYFKQLHKLDLSGTNLRGSGLKHLKELSELRELNLACPMLTEAFLPALQELPLLRRLSLANTAITDDAVTVLAKISGLEELDVTGTKLSADGVARLKTALPDSKIIGAP